MFFNALRKIIDLHIYFQNLEIRDFLKQLPELIITISIQLNLVLSFHHKKLN
jgi:hypothetical protein